LAIVLVTAVLTRLLFVLWGWSGAGVHARLGFSALDIASGYAISAGLGYVTGEGPARAALMEFRNQVDSGLVEPLPGRAGTLAQADLIPQMMHPPGFSVLVAGLYRVFGLRADRPLEVIGTVLDTTAAGLVWWIATLAFGARCGLLAGLAYALFPPLAYWSAVSKSVDGMLSVFIVGYLASTLVAARAGTNRTATVWSLGSGAVLGLGSYLRPDYLLLPVFLALPLFVLVRSMRRTLIVTGVAMGTTLIVLVPWAARNHTLSGRWIFTSTSVGGTLINGLGEFDNPWGFGHTDLDRYQEAKALGYPSPWLPEADAHFRRLFWRSVWDQPLAFASLLLRKAPFALATPYTWGYVNPNRTRSFTQAMREEGADRYAVARRSPRYVLGAYWDRIVMSALVLLCSLSAAFMLLAERARIGLAALILGPHIYSMGIHMLTLLGDRYLLPSMFCWLIALGFTLDRLGSWIRAKSPVPQPP
jgi:hypothetical protein